MVGVYGVGKHSDSFLNRTSFELQEGRFKLDIR